MANDMDMLKDITELETDKKTLQQAWDLADLYTYKHIEPNPKKLEYLKKLYKEKYGFLDNYV